MHGLTRAGALCLLVALPSFAQVGDSATIERPAPRVRAGIAVGPMGAVVQPGLAVGLGLAGDLGVVASDRVALSVRVAAALGFLLYGAATVNGEYALSDSVAVSVGAGLVGAPGGMPGSPHGAGVLFPLRGTLWLGERGEGDSRRRGFVISLSLSPGFSFAGGAALPGYDPKFPGFAFATELTLGYALF